MYKIQTFNNERWVDYRPGKYFHSYLAAYKHVANFNLRGYNKARIVNCKNYEIVNV